MEVGRAYSFDAGTLCNEWVAFSTRMGACELEMNTLEQLEAQLHTSSRKTPTARRTISKTRGITSPGGAGTMVMSQDNLDDL